KDGFVVNTILKEADLFCPNSVRINFTIYHSGKCKKSSGSLNNVRKPSTSFYFFTYRCRINDRFCATI
ncbi:hypothetical protein EFS30_05805, partial [Levilactobacillus parabrevis]|nr:hypothetical protein [Levilactobacillus parabrevis]